MNIWCYLKMALQLLILSVAAVASGACGLNPPPQEYSATVEVYEYDAATDTWTEKAPMPKPKIAPLRVECGGLIYLIGGRAGTYGDRDRPFVDMYDPAADSWSGRANVPFPAVDGHSACCSVGGRIYVPGSYIRGNHGCAQLPVLLEYDPAADTWAEKAPMPVAREGGRCFVIGDEIYLACEGAPPDYGRNKDYRPPFMQKYNSTTDTWTVCAPPQGYPLISTGGKIYTIGGWEPVSYYYVYVGSVYEYDPASDTWTQKSSKPSSLYPLVLVECSGKIYAFCSKDEPVEEYDPASDTWMEKTRFPGAPGGIDYFGDIVWTYAETASWVQVGSKIYVLGGYRHTSSGG